MAAIRWGSSSSRPTCGAAPTVASSASSKDSPRASASRSTSATTTTGSRSRTATSRRSRISRRRTSSGSSSIACRRSTCRCTPPRGTRARSCSTIRACRISRRSSSAWWRGASSSTARWSWCRGSTTAMCSRSRSATCTRSATRASRWRSSPWGSRSSRTSTPARPWTSRTPRGSWTLQNGGPRGRSRSGARSGCTARTSSICWPADRCPQRSTTATTRRSRTASVP